MKACLCLHRSCGAATVILQCPRPLLRTQAHLGQRVVLKQTVAARSGSLICDSLSTMAGCMAAVSNTAELGASIQAVSSPATCSQTDKQNKPNTTAILWFRRDLRLQDNSALVAACQSSSYLLPVYILDPREMEPRRSLKEGGLGVPKLGPHRCRFMLEAVQDLKQQLQDLGSDLIFHIGKPEDVIPQIIRQLTAAQQGIQHIALYHHLDVMPESVDLEDRVHAALAAAGGAAGASTSAHAYWGLTLYHPDDLPGFGGAAKRPQHASSMPRCNKDPSRLSALPDVMTNFRKVYHEVAAVKQEAQRLGMPEAECDWLVMHLQIRDFYLFTALKEGAAVLEAGGLQHSPMQWEHSPQAFSKWAQSRTGVPFVDACMAELVATGWMSNRGRQNVASFLTKTLHQDWRLGAELFESLLVDHDVGVNYVNWNYFAGVGNDPRNRHFKTVTQGMQYDEAASLITSWIPALANLPTEFKHKPFSMTPEQQLAFSCRLGVDYPEPIIDPGSQIGVLGLKGKKAAAGAPSKAKPAKGAGK